MTFPPDVEFHEDIRLLVYRPRGLIDEAAVNKIISVIEEIEAATQEPFNRFSDASEIHEVELNFRYVIEVLSIGGLPIQVAHRSSQRFSPPIPPLFITPGCSSY